MGSLKILFYLIGNLHFIADLNGKPQSSSILLQLQMAGVQMHIQEFSTTKFYPPNLEEACKNTSFLLCCIILLLNVFRQPNLKLPAFFASICRLIFATWHAVVLQNLKQFTDGMWY